MSLRSRFFRVIIDPNVLIAASISPNGSCARLLELAVGGDFTLVGSPHLLDELADVLHREKFRRWLSEKETVDFLQAVRNVCDVLPDPSSVGLAPVTADPKDDYLVLLYESAEATFIVSGDTTYFYCGVLAWTFDDPPMPSARSSTRTRGMNN